MTLVWPPYLRRWAERFGMTPEGLHTAIRKAEKRTDLPRGEISRELRRLDEEL